MGLPTCGTFMDLRTGTNESASDENFLANGRHIKGIGGLKPLLTWYNQLYSRPAHRDHTPAQEWSSLQFPLPM